MIFRRTSKGISNQHLFHAVDYIVFVEGGESYSKKEVYEGKFDASTTDILFWMGLFSHYLKTKKFQFRSIGSKATLHSIIEDIENGLIEHVYVAMDRDHDLFINNLPSNKYVIYTYGYSWENDVWNPVIIQDVLETICSASNVDVNIYKEISRLYDAFFKNMHKAVCADAFLYCQDGKSLIPREKYLACLNFGKKIPPSVKLTKIHELLSTINHESNKIDSFEKKHQIFSSRDCYGHLVADFCYWLIIYLMNKIKKLTSIAKYFINCIAIKQFIINLANDEFTDLDIHYSSFLTA